MIFGLYWPTWGCIPSHVWSTAGWPSASPTERPPVQRQQPAWTSLLGPADRGLQPTLSGQGREESHYQPTPTNKQQQSLVVSRFIHCISFRNDLSISLWYETDGDPGLWFCSLTGFIQKNMGKMSHSEKRKESMMNQVRRTREQWEYCCLIYS